MEKTIKEIHSSKTGKSSDKWESYLDYYDALLHPYRNSPVRRFEIGVQNSGSLETWAQYFSHGTHFVGCDINVRCRQLVFDDSRIHVVVGDANSPDAYAAVRSISNTYDVIIDDGAHRSTDIVQSFVNYFPMVAPGGVYVVEDTHALYGTHFGADYGGGILNERSAIKLFLKLADVVNYEWWHQDVELHRFMTSFFPAGVPDFIAAGWVASVSFRNSIVEIRKEKTPGHRKVGRRLVCGTDRRVSDP
jgi:cephalosporin hydroxylase